MLELSLFLGFSPDEAFENELEKTNPFLVSYLIGKEEFLLEIEYCNRRYLGKRIHGHPSLEQLESLEKHLLSLLEKLTPNYPFSANPPVLVTCNGK